MSDYAIITNYTFLAFAKTKKDLKEHAGGDPESMREVTAAQEGAGVYFFKATHEGFDIVKLSEQNVAQLKEFVEKIPTKM